jgi:hypothetical protein
MMKKVLTFAIFIHFFSCSKDIAIPFETTVTVLDVDNKPIKGRKVIAGYSFGGKSEIASAITGVDGTAILNYDVSRISDAQTLINVFAEEDPSFKSLDSYQHSESSFRKKSYLIVMDSLIKLKLRLVKTDTVPLVLGINTIWFSNIGLDRVSQNKYFHNWVRDSIRTFDSTFVFSVWQKTHINISAGISKVNGNNVTPLQNINKSIKAIELKDSTYLIKF